MNQRRWPALSNIGLALSIVLSACASATTTAPAPASTASGGYPSPPATQDSIATSLPNRGMSPAGQTVELRVTWWGSLEEHRRTLKVIQVFQQHYPHIRITSEFSGLNLYWVMLEEMADSGDLPDVMQQDRAHLPDWSARGLLLPLDDYTRDGILNLTEASEETLQGGRVDGQQMGSNCVGASTFWSITARSRHPREAAMFIDFSINSIEANEVLMAERDVPTSTGAQGAIRLELGKVPGSGN